ncbi:MAG: hypothetical protein ACRDG2_11700 [Actinomycetota bacterium]
MNKRILVSVAWAVAGFAVAVGVMAWAFALAGQEISEPATPSLFSLSPTPDEGIDRSPSATPGTPTPSPSERDDDNSGPGAGSDDNSGPGSDDSALDNSGPGSDDSGSSSDYSGSGSSSSGSGSSGSSDRDDD